MDRSETLSITEELRSLCEQGKVLEADCENNLYAAMMDTQGSDEFEYAFEVLKRFSKVVGESPFDRIASDCAGVIAGNVGWSAERDGKRLPQYWLEYGIDGDWFYYAMQAARGLDDSVVLQKSTVAVLSEALDELMRLRERMSAALQALL